MEAISKNIKESITLKLTISFVLAALALTIIAAQFSTTHAFHQVVGNPLMPSDEFTQCLELEDHESVTTIQDGITLIICKEIDTSVEDEANTGTEDAPVIGRITIPDGFPSNPNEIIASSVIVVIGLGGLVFFVMLFLGGLRFLTAGGDEKALQEARRGLTNAFIGLVIIIAAFLIAEILFAVFGISALVNII